MHLGGTIGHRREELADLACNIVALEIGVPIDPMFSPHVGAIDMKEMHLFEDDATALYRVCLDGEIVQVFWFDSRV